MANTKTKIVLAGLVVVVIIAAAMSSASAAPQLPKDKPPEDDDEPPSDEEISIDMPGPSPEGAPGEGPEIIVEEVLPEGEEDEEMQMSIPAPPPVSSSAPPPQESFAPVERDLSLAANAGRERMEQAAQSSLAPPRATLLENAVAADAAASGQPEAQVIQAVAKDITGSANPTPLAQQELSQQEDPHGTLALARVLLSRENLPGWSATRSVSCQRGSRNEMSGSGPCAARR
jgi:hypothetical protein